MDNQNLNNNQNNNQNNHGNNNAPKKKKPGFSFVLMVTLFTMLLVMFVYRTGGVKDNNVISYDKFLHMVEQGKVEKVEIQDDQIVITEKKEKETDLDRLYYTGVVEDDS